MSGGTAAPGGKAAVAQAGGARPPRAWRRRPASLKARMALVLGLVLLPPAAYAVAEAAAAYRAQAARQGAELRDAAGRVADAAASALAEARDLLERVAASPELRAVLVPGASAVAGTGTDDRAAACAGLLRGELGRAGGRVADLVLAGADGRVACATAGATAGLDHAGSAWFREAVESGGPGLAFGPPPIPTSAPAAGPTIVLSVPLRADADHAVGVLAATLSLGDPGGAGGTSAGVELPPGAVVRLLGPMAGAPTPADAPGPAAIRRLLLAAGPGTVELLAGDPGAGGRFTAAPVAGSGGRLQALVGLPAAPALAWLGRDLVLGLLVPVLSLALAVIAVWIATDYLVNRHVQALAAAARAYAAARRAGHAGGHAAGEGWPPLPDAPAELRDLAGVLGRTADELGAREAELEASLHHKELLLREVHHRVRNNLQVVSSLLNLRAQGAAEPAARAALLAAQGRVKALALVHRDLYEGDEPGTVELRPLLAELCDLLEDTVPGRPAGVEVRRALGSARVGVDRAVPVALFLTEALSNALGHAFPDGRGGTVTVRLAAGAGGRAGLAVEDDGVGLGIGPGAAAVDGARGGGGRRGLGLTLMRMLAGQAGGRLAFGPGPGGIGTRAEFDFPVAGTATAAGAGPGAGAAARIPPPAAPAARPMAASAATATTAATA